MKNRKTPQFDRIFEHLALPCCVIDSEGRVVAWNRALVETTGISRRKAIGKPLASLGEFAGGLYEQWKCVAAGEPVPVNAVNIGEFSYLPAFASIPAIGWSIVLEAKQPVTIKGKRTELISSVSHDLKTPLSAMRGYVSLVENLGVLNDKQKQYVTRLNTSIDEMLDMIENLLDMAWVDAGMKLELAEVDLAHLAKHISNKYKELAHSHQIELKQQIQDVPPIQGDERRLKQVVDNLISNAIKYSPEGGEVTISVRNSNGQVTLAVEDTGMGIPPEHHEDIFKRFYRINNEKTHRIKGSGLGLAISYDIVREHGSVLKVESTPGSGSKFYFSLPVPE